MIATIDVLGIHFTVSIVTFIVFVFIHFE